MRDEKNKSSEENQVVVIKQELTYDFGFDTDPTKFLAGDMFKVTAVTKDWLVLANFHGTTELNTTNSYVRGARTLSWANPYEYVHYLFKSLKDAHDYSALLLDWGAKPDISSDKHLYYRDHVTYMIIPPGKEMTFLIGFAAPQNQKDERSGGGVQLRLKNLPANTITVQTALKLSQSKSMDGNKESKTYDFDQAYATAMQALETYLDSPVANGINVPNRVFTPPSKVYSAAFEDFEIEEFNKDEISYCENIIKQFDVSKYVNDKFRVIRMEEVETAPLLQSVA